MKYKYFDVEDIQNEQDFERVMQTMDNLYSEHDLTKTAGTYCLRRPCGRKSKVVELLIELEGEPSQRVKLQQAI